MESEKEWREVVDRVSMIAKINTSNAGLLPLALYYAHHAVRHGMHRELTMLQKVPQSL